MTKIAVEIACTIDRCNYCIFVDTDHGPYEGFCPVFSIKLEPDEAERYPDEYIDVFFRCQECLESTIK